MDGTGGQRKELSSGDVVAGSLHGASRKKLVTSVVFVSGFASVPVDSGNQVDFAKNPSRGSVRHPFCTAYGQQYSAFPEEAFESGMDAGDAGRRYLFLLLYMY